MVFETYIISHIFHNNKYIIQKNETYVFYLYYSFFPLSYSKGFSLVDLCDKTQIQTEFWGSLSKIFHYDEYAKI